MAEPLDSKRKLVLALEATQDPRLAPVIERARSGYYSDFGSPLASPELQLMADLRELGHVRLVERVLNDEFSATPEEADAWMRSPEGQEVFAELLRGPQGMSRPDPGRKPQRGKPKRRKGRKR